MCHLSPEEGLRKAELWKRTSKGDFPQVPYKGLLTHRKSFFPHSRHMNLESHDKCAPKTWGQLILLFKTSPYFKCPHNSE